MQFRCPSRIFAIVEGGLLEVKCPSKGCKTDDGQVVFHYFDPASGKLVETKRYRDAADLTGHKTKKENINGAHHDAAAVRTS